MRGRISPAWAALGLAAVLGVVVLFLVLSRGDSPESAHPAVPAAPGPASTAPEPTTVPAEPTLSPFTGRPVSGARPVLAVKIDNVRPARPQTGLDSADIVYVEPVEGGLSRIMAIFSGSLPGQVGPVRSARESDLELLAQYGHPGLAFSGANGTVLAAIRKAPVVNLSPDEMSSAYSRSRAKAAPHNLIADPKRLLERASGVSRATDIGFRFGAQPADQSTPTTRKTVRYGAASTGFSWSADRHRWQVSLDGRAATTTDGVRLSAATVVVQYTRITSSRLHDVLGNPTPYTNTVGSGRAVVLRDGVAFAAHWSRPTDQDGTTFTTASGAPLPFAVGPVWVVFAPA